MNEVAEYVPFTQQETKKVFFQFPNKTETWKNIIIDLHVPLRVGEHTMRCCLLLLAVAFATDVGLEKRFEKPALIKRRLVVWIHLPQ